MVKTQASSPLRFKFGTPIQTGAIVTEIPVQVSHDSLPFTSLERSPEKIRFTLSLKETDAVYGLGQVLGPLNRRGKHFRIFNRDDALHVPDKPGLYGAHPFMYVEGQALALFVDCPAEITFDIGYNHYDEIEIEVHATRFDLYVWKPPTLRAASESFLALVGAPLIPPRWSFGYQQCRYSYPDEKTVRSVAHELRAKGLPCDTIYLDIDYMKDYKVFTFDEGRFPDVANLVEDLRAMGFHVVPIVDPGIRVEKGYEPYDSGIEGEVFCKKEDGTPFVGAVWPGLTTFPDFHKKVTRDWWTKCHEQFVKLGFEHYWNDMNEPAIFYTPDRLANIPKVAAALPKDHDLRTEPFDYLERLAGFLGAENYYDEFYQDIGEAEPVPHRAVHNLYGASMVRATKETLDYYLPGKRHFILTRSSYIGTHRNGVMWTGDNHSWWEHMLAHMRMLQSLNLVGFFFCGSDVGGFSANTSPELVIRWMQLGVFSPLFRNHSSKNTRGQEPWMFGEKPLGIMRASLELRSSLMTYIYSEYLHAVDQRTPFISSLLYHYGDPISKITEDQFFVGRSLLACPVHQSNARGRSIHLPGDTHWLVWRPKQWDDFSCEIMEPGQHFVDIALDQTCIALEQNKLLVLHAPRQHDGEAFPDELLVLGLVDGQATITVSGDDGENEKSERWTLEITVTDSSLVSQKGGIGCPFKIVRCLAYLSDGKQVMLNHEIG